ncbi:hypothetical protein CFC21_019304 [Triticum aestivum]|uniref:Homeobox domain-containing protein n=2 Tax=Triticum aestivum TaxID=4565 RepID=A0A9R1E5X3_WHEAT
MDKQSVMWRQLQHQHHQASGAAGGNAVAAAGAGATTTTAPVRPSGARWTPTPEQVKILKDLYYDCGIRSPTAEQIQRIAARLRQYGRIEGKNVFYWFQNHKARERQKKRLGVDVNGSPLATATAADVLALSPSGAAAGLYGAGSCAGRGAAVHPDASATTTTCWGDSTLQDYMGARSTAGAGNHGGAAAAAPTPWPAASFPFSTNQTPPMPPPRELPLFPTGGGRQESADDFNGSSYHLQPNSSQWWEAAAASNANAMAVVHHQLLQEQHEQQHSFYNSSGNQQQMMMMMPIQDAGTSPELTLRAPYM